MNKKLKAILLAFLLLITATILPTQNVKAASKSTMTKAYKKYLKKHVSKNKRYAIVNIGDNNKPALLIGSSNTMDYAGNGKYFGCSVYYYQNGKIKKVCVFSGARRISLRKKNKKYYIYTGASDVSENLRITVTYIVVALESTIVGPAAGMVSAFVTDNLSFILYPDGAYFPGYTLTAMLGSLIYSLCLYQKKITITRIAIAKTINNYLVNVAIGSLWSSMLYGNAYIVYATKSLVKNTILLPIEIVLLVVVLNLLLPVLQKKKLVNSQELPIKLY